MLRDYAKEDNDRDSADGAASGIIGLLEVAESDFSKGLAVMIAEQESAAAAYESETMENQASKEQDRKCKTKEAAALDKSSAGLTSDRSGHHTPYSELRGAPEEHPVLLMEVPYAIVSNRDDLDKIWREEHPVL